ncbi:MAG TPA: histidine phosphatase family protein [Candidatus Paceibacterota bacterium]|jgi:broad specificity phosphatase PhoE|nr:histidine phosphatase family protein [Candidatus Paceibacterota bacterium]
MKLYIVRHGQTDENLRGIMLGTKMDVPLSDTGKNQARDIILDQDFDVIFSSPMKRTLQTAEIINQTLQKPLIVTGDLMERDKGVLEGKTQQEIMEYTHGALNEAILSKKLKFDFSPYGGDSIEAVESRIKSFVTEVLKHYRNKKILVVTHLGVIRVMFLMYAGKPPDSEENGAVNILDIGD